MSPITGRVSGPITDRLLADPTLTVEGWWPDRDAVLRTACRPAAVGYRIGQRRRRKRTPFALALLNITGPSLALILLLGVTQAQQLLYVAQTVVMLP